MNGLSVLNLELTNRCQKNCWMCGRRKVEKEFPELAQTYNKDMDFELLEHIAKQVPKDITIQFHNNGEPLLYPRLGEALDLFPNNIKCFNTNGILLLEKADEIIDRLDTLTISVIENDLEGEQQYDILTRFLKLKKSKRPYLIYRLLGNIDSSRYEQLDGLVCTRVLHNPMGSFSYRKSVTIPEIGICLDLLNHLVIDVYGNVYPCVRFDSHRHNLLGNVKLQTLEELWNCDKRKNLIKEHVKGNRNCSELCKQCDFYGCPTGV